MLSCKPLEDISFRTSSRICAESFVVSLFITDSLTEALAYEVDLEEEEEEEEEDVEARSSIASSLATSLCIKFALRSSIHLLCFAINSLRFSSAMASHCCKSREKEVVQAARGEACRLGVSSVQLLLLLRCYRTAVG